MTVYRNEVLNRDRFISRSPATVLDAEPLERGAPEVSAVQRTIAVRLWDLPIRLFHWSLVIAVLVAIVSAKVGGEWMRLHGQAGVAVVGLLIFRLIWGVVGSKSARFIHFIPSVSSVRSYLRGQWQGRGHNPLGALAVLSLLGLLLLQAIGGLFTDDEISFTGPLAHFLESETAVQLTGWHHQLSNVVIALLLLHIAAIFVYRFFKKKNLVKAMISGHEHLPLEQALQIPEEVPVRTWVLVLSLVFTVVLTYWIGTGLALPNTESANISTPATKESAPPPAW
ncbi:cytochrome b/b6 domain-containing protein [Undibacterium amnicola]|uniref:Cytochrome b/b6 domain-containing protein n=1 Tax=Undibacterium amnicola TaxID=1834038 RepID=A0ABR6XTB3_9BURK|nr:cytochrome b/b6 domain-containing protein [Undibacterium amnicola]MBC3832730.1 cytochrome b/b6 domain-containing protein [Undibacterium amnicola]